jgi:hypothetical protein
LLGCDGVDRHDDGMTQRVWVMDRGVISKKTLAFLGKAPRPSLRATLRNERKPFPN